MSVDPGPASDPAADSGPSSTRRAAEIRPSGPFVEDRAEEDAAEVVEAARERAEPRFQWPLTMVLVGLVVSLGIVAADHFRRGSVLFALVVWLAMGLRAVLSDTRAGWLAVRSRGVDLAVLGALAASLTVFSLIVPPPS
jgi:hypothetical protein